MLPCRYHISNSMPLNNTACTTVNGEQNDYEAVLCFAEARCGIICYTNQDVIKFAPWHKLAARIFESLKERWRGLGLGVDKQDLS